MPTVLEDVMFGPLNLGWSAAEAESRAVHTLGTLVFQEICYDVHPSTLAPGKSAA